MSEDKDNPYVSSETCGAFRQGIDQRFVDMQKLVEEKFKTLKTSIVVGFTVSTLIITVVQFIFFLKSVLS